jgi:hypothetical protein
VACWPLITPEVTFLVKILTILSWNIRQWLSVSLQRNHSLLETVMSQVHVLVLSCYIGEWSVALRDYHIKRNISGFIISYRHTKSINDCSCVVCSVSLVIPCCLKIYNFRVLFWLNTELSIFSLYDLWREISRQKILNRMTVVVMCCCCCSWMGWGASTWIMYICCYVIYCWSTTNLSLRFIHQATFCL